MANKGKIVLVCICVAMLMIISVIGTLAFADQTVTGKDHFGTDNIEIVLTEDISIDGVGTVSEDTSNGTVNFNNITPGDTVTNQIKVKNTNTATAAYVAVTITVNNADKIINAYKKANEIEILHGCGIAYDKENSTFIIGNYTNPYVKHIDFAETVNKTVVEHNGNWFDTADGADPYILAMTDHQLRYTYYIYLPANAECVVFESLNVPDSFDDEEMKMFQGLVIDVHSASVEANGEYNETEAKNAFRDLYTEVIQ